jgi:hypothetical protein
MTRDDKGGTAAPVRRSAGSRQGKAVHRRGRGAAVPSGPAKRRRAEGFGARLRYRFDTALSRGPSVIIGWLGLLTLLLIVVGALVMTVFRLRGINGGEKLGFFESFWQSMLRIVDAGTFAGDTSWPTRLLGLVVTVAGIFIAGSLIGLIANAVDQRIEELRKGRSNVIESDHTVILGWSPRVPALVSELVIANESRKRAAVVVVAATDKTEMEEVLRRTVPDSKTTRIVCRSGEPWMTDNLDMANLAHARSVIVVGNGDDAWTVKVVLAVRAFGEAAAAESSFAGHVVAEVDSESVAASLQSLSGGGLVVVRSDDVVAELTAQACRQRGLSVVFRELLDFDGDELYFSAFDELTGTSYAACQLAFEACSLIGILDRDGQIQLNPPADRPLAAGEQLIGIAEDDSLFVPSPQPATGHVQQLDERNEPDIERRIVVAGWSSLGPRVVAELDEFMPPGTTIEIVVDPDMVDVSEIRTSVDAVNVRLEVSDLRGGPETIASHAARVAFDEVIVLGYRDALSVDDADARTLLTLLAFRQQHGRDGRETRIVAELLDQRHAHLAAASGADDFIVSDELTSLMLAQVSERSELNLVFRDLFDRDGSAIELYAVERYGAQLATCFADVVATASAMGQTAIGYRDARSGEVVVNPPKSEPLALDRADEVIVVAG